MEAIRLECQTCGGSIALSADGKSGRCEFCGNVYHYREPKSPAVIMGLNEANEYRRNNDFDSAIIKYRSVLTQVHDDADVYWGLTLSEYGIEFVPDADGRYVPTCRRTVPESILESESYRRAIEFASPEQAESFRRTAREIDVLQRRIAKQLEQEEDYDVFLSFKSTDGNDRPTEDRYIARKIYEALEKYGIRTFYSEESLRGRMGDEYEPIIYRALYSSKVFILIATNEAYVQAPWVKNEWSRYRDRLAETPGLQAFAVFRGIRPTALPAAFRGQGVDLSKYPAGGYEVEIADNLAVKFGKKEKARGVDVNALKEQLWQELKGAGTGRGAGAQEGQLFQASVALNGGKFDDAAAMYSAILERDGQCAEAYWGKALAAAKCKNDAELIRADAAGYKRALTGDNFRFAVKYARGALSEKIAATMNAMREACGKNTETARKDMADRQNKADELSAEIIGISKQIEAEGKKKQSEPPLPGRYEYHMPGWCKWAVVLCCLAAIGIVTAVFLPPVLRGDALSGDQLPFILLWGLIGGGAAGYGGYIGLRKLTEPGRRRAYDRNYQRVVALRNKVAQQNMAVDGSVAALRKKSADIKAAVENERRKAQTKESESADWNRYGDYLGTLLDWQTKNVLRGKQQV